MQSNNRYSNLIRATELARNKGVPFEPYDGEELRMFSLITALDHLPKNSPEFFVDSNGWKLYSTIDATTALYPKFVDSVDLLVDDLSGNKVGIMVSPDRGSFLVFTKQ
jgi:hypothetical protein